MSTTTTPTSTPTTTNTPTTHTSTYCLKRVGTQILIDADSPHGCSSRRCKQIKFYRCMKIAESHLALFQTTRNPLGLLLGMLVISLRENMILPTHKIPFYLARFTVGVRGNAFPAFSFVATFSFPVCNAFFAIFLAKIFLASSCLNSSRKQPRIVQN